MDQTQFRALEASFAPAVYRYHQLRSQRVQAGQSIKKAMQRVRALENQLELLSATDPSSLAPDQRASLENLKAQLHQELALAQQELDTVMQQFDKVSEALSASIAAIVAMAKQYHAMEKILHQRLIEVNQQEQALLAKSESLHLAPPKLPREQIEAQKAEMRRIAACCHAREDQAAELLGPEFRLQAEIKL